jgi:hypothetical protein
MWGRRVTATCTCGTLDYLHLPALAGKARVFAGARDRLCSPSRGYAAANLRYTCLRVCKSNPRPLVSETVCLFINAPSL